MLSAGSKGGNNVMLYKMDGCVNKISDFIIKHGDNDSLVITVQPR